MKTRKANRSQPKPRKGKKATESQSHQKQPKAKSHQRNRLDENKTVLHLVAVPRTSHSSKDGLVANSQKPRKQRKPNATKAKSHKSHGSHKSHKSHGSHKSHEKQKNPKLNDPPFTTSRFEKKGIGACDGLWLCCWSRGGDSRSSSCSMRNGGTPRPGTITHSPPSIGR